MLEILKTKRDLESFVDKIKNEIEQRKKVIRIIENRDTVRYSLLTNTKEGNYTRTYDVQITEEAALQLKSIVKKEIKNLELDLEIAEGNLKNFILQNLT